ncbi:MAG: ABC transporter permease, partial [Burkholderiaceae bacterium]|nr:ABC transporter permease [Burkholderiaceae bacterium]
MDALAALIAITMNAGTPLLLAATGIVINERSGVVNLGTEGMMLVAAVVAFAATLATGQYWIGLAAGAIAGLLMAALFAAFAISLMANQFATGLALALLGAGVA